MRSLLFTSMLLPAAGLLAVSLCGMPVCWIYNPTPSAPEGFYAIEPMQQPHVGQHVLVRLPDALSAFAAHRGYLPERIPLVKRVAAVGSQHVCVQGGAMQIDGRSVAQLRDADAQGRPLSPWHGCRRLAADELFVLSETSPASFDSRYFGPITRERVIGRARPLWTWLPDEASAGH